MQGIDTAELFAFTGATQAAEWEKVMAVHGDPNEPPDRPGRVQRDGSVPQGPEPGEPHPALQPDPFGQHLDSLLQARVGPAAATLVTWDFHSIDGQDVVRVSVEPADFPVEEGVDADQATFWWRYPTGTRAVNDPTEADRIVRRRFGIGGGPAT